VFFGAKTRPALEFSDPSKATGTDAEQLAVYRQVRDAIRERIELELVTNRGRPAGPSGERRRVQTVCALRHTKTPRRLRASTTRDRDRIATFETEPRHNSDYRALLADRAGPLPDASWSSVVAKSWLGQCCTLSVTARLRPDCRALGLRRIGPTVARALCRRALEGLLAEAERLGLLKTGEPHLHENHAGLALHRQVWFSRSGRLPAARQTDGAWRDCVIVEILLGESRHRRLASTEGLSDRNMACPERA